MQQIQGDIAACTTLLDLLERERVALGKRDMDTLDELIEQKAAQLKWLEKSSQTRTQWAREQLRLDPADQDTMKAAWQTMLENSPTPELSKSWETLKTLQDACKQANEVNGKILARNQKTFGRLIEIVRGQTATPNLYSTAGKSTGNQISHKLGEA
jgi:Flagellar biosynthesis/type III secretory pathway chaperone